MIAPLGIALLGGLSPRVRGSRRRRLPSRLRLRSIPACAGEPPPRGIPGPWQRVYPRVCGGASAAGPASTLVEGLSPRVRGSPSYQPQLHHRNGSIPACAGEPRIAGLPTAAGRVYPRVCGGAHATKRLDSQCLRSIPACAGEPYARLRTLDHVRVYPRVCGGAFSTAASTWLVMGLSPRVRGSRVYAILPEKDRRSIPACAGEPGCSDVRPWPR